MQSRARSGRALRDGQVVAAEVEVVERVEVDALPVDLPGTTRRDFKPRTTRHPTTIRFVSIEDRELRSDLERLALAARDVDVARRDRGWRPKPLDLALEEDADFAGAYVGRPLNGFGAVEAIEFDLGHEDL